MFPIFVFSKIKTIGLIIFLGQALWAGGSRVGNGSNSGSPIKSGIKIQIDPSFEVETPFPFIQKRKYEEGIKVEGPLHIKLIKTSLGIEPVPTYQKLEVLSIDKVMPELKNIKESESISQYLQGKKWKSIETKNKCIKVQSIENKSEVSYVVTWENQQGFLLISSQGQVAQEAALKTIESTKLLKRDCLWK